MWAQLQQNRKMVRPYGNEAIGQDTEKKLLSEESKRENNCTE